jgi:hypothetical protein
VPRGAGGRPPHQDDILRHRDALGHMRWGLRPESNRETLRIVLANPVEKDSDAGGIEARPLPPAGLPQGGLHGGIAPGHLLQGLDALHRRPTVARKPPVAGPVQAQTALVLAADAHRLGRRLSASGRHGTEAARAWRDKGRRRRVFLPDWTADASAARGAGRAQSRAGFYRAPPAPTPRAAPAGSPESWPTRARWRAVRSLAPTRRPADALGPTEPQALWRARGQGVLRRDRCVTRGPPGCEARREARRLGAAS